METMRTWKIKQYTRIQERNPRQRLSWLLSNKQGMRKAAGLTDDGQLFSTGAALDGFHGKQAKTIQPYHPNDWVCMKKSNADKPTIVAIQIRNRFNLLPQDKITCTKFFRPLQRQSLGLVTKGNRIRLGPKVFKNQGGPRPSRLKIVNFKNG